MTELPTGLDPDPGFRGGVEAWLHPAELDLLCTFAEIAAPFPLRAKALGDRRAAYAAARAQLHARGLADHRGPRGIAADLVHLLREGAGALDIMVARRGQVHGAVVLAQRGEGLLITQDIRTAGARAHLLALSAHDAVDRMVDLVPDLAPALSAPFSVPRAALDRVHRAIQAATEPDGSPRRLEPDEVDRLLRAHGIDDQTARKMATHLQPVLGNGQAGVAVRRGYGDEWTRSGDEVRWLDTARGRFRLAADETGEWMSVNPLPREELRTQIRGLAGELWW
ncbi:ESX secretion-associated protein EspG [Actinokineospora auranticolor]|uniref:ESAT-6 protein secretion system EspG family protein n=1 Tax=Actinokineospora auranticolor TaxID=155976 RepID=A0A2S6GXY5_9PSEU|nr:ESX secretion-associated protein EspG [Actinokineospora auranticolor]PPK70095.1 ESAT-6 protein secretion system EspG family protein [Actinokineospora auranticolor]